MILSKIHPKFKFKNKDNISFYYYRQMLLNIPHEVVLIIKMKYHKTSIIGTPEYQTALHSEDFFNPQHLHIYMILHLNTSE